MDRVGADFAAEVGGDERGEVTIGEVAVTEGVQAGCDVRAGERAVAECAAL